MSLEGSHKRSTRTHGVNEGQNAALRRLEEARKGKGRLQQAQEVLTFPL